MQNFEICVRAIIEQKGKILVCYQKEKRYFFFPGGHLNFGERVEDALERELNEELGIKIKNFSFAGIVDNVYEEEGRKHHEINLVFKVKPKKLTAKSKETHIDFIFFDKKTFQKEKVLPIALQRAILKFQKRKKIFWASQFFEKTILRNLR